MLEEDDEGNIVERVVETGDDHFFHASGYGLMGLNTMQAAMISILISCNLYCMVKKRTSVLILKDCNGRKKKIIIEKLKNEGITLKLC